MEFSPASIIDHLKHGWTSSQNTNAVRKTHKKERFTNGAWIETDQDETADMVLSN